MRERGESLGPVKALGSAWWRGLRARHPGERRGLEQRGVRQPNRRVQRTRSSPSALRSPLTRYPLGRGRTCLLLVACGLVLAPGLAHSQDSAQHWLRLPMKPGLLAGFGSHPINAAVASMWFASGPMPKSGMRPALMVYYRGPNGWLNKDVTPLADLTQDPAIADFLIGDVRLLLKFWPEKNMINLFGQDVSVAEKNVVVVTRVAVSGSTPVVTAVATFRDLVPDGANPAIFVLERTPEAVKALNTK